MLAVTIGTRSTSDSRESHLAIRVAFSIDPEYSKKLREKATTVRDRKA